MSTCTLFVTPTWMTTHAGPSKPPWCPLRHFPGHRCKRHAIRATIQATVSAAYRQRGRCSSPFGLTLSCCWSIQHGGFRKSNDFSSSCRHCLSVRHPRGGLGGLHWGCHILRDLRVALPRLTARQPAEVRRPLHEASTWCHDAMLPISCAW